MAPHRDWRQRLALAAAPPLGAALLRTLALTWRVQEAGRVDLSPFKRPPAPTIYAVWHESTLAAAFYRGEKLHALASRSFDGEIISHTLRKLGWPAPARGSSHRGGDSGLRELRAFLDRGEAVLLTVDGPKGPRRRAKDGAVQLAKWTGRAVVPVAFACRPALRLKSWDRMAVPTPLARGVFWFGDELLPRSRSGAGLEALQAGLDEANRKAEAFLDAPARFQLSASR